MKQENPSKTISAIALQFSGCNLFSVSYVLTYARRTEINLLFCLSNLIKEETQWVDIELQKQKMVEVRTKTKGECNDIEF